MLLSNIRWKDLLDALLRLEWSRRNIKTSSPNRCSGIFLVESIEGWSKKQDKTSKQTSDHQTNQSGRSKQSLHESHGEARGERDVIRLRNLTEDKRAFRRMLTSADRTGMLRKQIALECLWVECTLKRSNTNTEPFKRDYFMRHSVRFTNIEMLMIENAFCKHPWISDNISRDQKQLDDSDRLGRIGNLNTAILLKWKGFKKSCLE